MVQTKNRLRLAVLQRVCPPYRVPAFLLLSQSENVEVQVFIGEDLPNSKVKSASDLSGIPMTVMRTRFIKLGRRIFPVHLGLIKALRNYAPDVILCEGESHFFGYLQAIIYQRLFNRQVKLVHWCFITLPGDPDGGRGWPVVVKRFFRNFFDGFLVYSSFSGDSLKRLGIPESKIFVATNVGDTDSWDMAATELQLTQADARNMLGLPDRFTVLYLGTLDSVKRPELLIHLAQEAELRQANFCLLGSGPILDPLREWVDDLKLDNVFLPGRVEAQRSVYLRAADVLVIPGRGGIVISEAMAFGLPVLVHEADGTEYDLVKNGETGYRLADGSLTSFKEALLEIMKDPGGATLMGQRAKEIIRDRYSIRHFVKRIEAAVIKVSRAGGRV